MKVIVCQHGNRRRYAVPQMLYQAGMLEALYTDSCAASPMGKLVGKLPFLKRLNPSLDRLSRRMPQLPPEKICASDRTFRAEVQERILHSRTDQYWRWCRILSRDMKKWGVRNADWIYNMYCENLDFLRYVRREHPNVKIMIDVYMHPGTREIIRREAEKYPIPGSEESKSIEVLPESTIREALSLADILLSPSEFVAQGIRELMGDEIAPKIRIAPYGSSITYTETNVPQRGRFFFAGGSWFGKGLHHFARAARILKEKYPEMDFRVAGVSSPHVLTHPDFQSLHFLGRLNKEEMKREFLTADAFVLPSLSEGMAAVVIEAMAAGCPVAITRTCGIDAVRDGENGCIIEPDAASIVSKLEMLYQDRGYRTRIAEATKTTAAEYSISAWQKRLINLF
jgi:glycosyltransferase involved in cell wall biosynthesis